MSRRLARILCLIALLVQVGTGALPTGEFCLWCRGDDVARPACACCADECADDEPAPCCCPLGAEHGRGGCDRCLRVHTPERHAVAAVRIGLDLGAGLALALPPIPAILPPAEIVAERDPWHSPPNESPPHLAALRTVCMTV